MGQTFESERHTKSDSNLRKSLEQQQGYTKGQLGSMFKRGGWNVKNFPCFQEREGVFVYTGKQVDTRFSRPRIQKKEVSLVSILKAAQVNKESI